MRRILFLTILATLYSGSLLALQGSPCSLENILAQSFSKKRVDNLVVSTEHWSVMPKELSPNSGDYLNLKFTKAIASDEVQLIYKDKKGVQKISATLTDKGVAKINFTKWFDEVYSFKGGTLLIKLVRNKSTEVCEYKMEIEGED